MPKPKEILELEKKLNVIFEVTPDDFYYFNFRSQTYYKTDENDQITELVISNSNLKDIYFLINFTSLTHLYLDHNEISDISGLEKLSSLIWLDLSFNNISDISGLKNLTSLTNLNFDHNKISDILILKNLTSLTYLNLDHNKVSDILILKNLTSLTYLNLSHNKVSDILILMNLTSLAYLNLNSNEISDISKLENFTSLTSLDLSYNDISDISGLKNLTSLTDLSLVRTEISDISGLENLTSLTILYLNINYISDISGLKNLTSLISLDLSENQISDISEVEHLTSLTGLHLSYNDISDITVLENLASSLTDLNLSFNYISDILGLKNLTSLTYLDLYSNKISSLTELQTIVQELKNLDELDVQDNLLPIESSFLDSLDSLRAYFKNQEKGVTDKRNVKLIFLGDGCAGKSTLLSHLKTLSPPDAIPIDQRTEGIQLDAWKEYFPEYTVNVWDFGGQDILHSTHRLFLGERAIYILVWCKKGNKKCTKDEEHPLSYWLDFIASYGKKSIVLLVENVIDGKFASPDEFPDDLALHDLVAHYKQNDLELIPTHYRIDCKHDTSRVKGLKDAIGYEINNLQEKFPLENYPANIYNLQEALNRKSKTHKSISLDEYQQIAEDNEVEDPKSLLAHYEDTGVLGYFKELPFSIVLQMEWVLEAMYAALKLKDNPLALTKGKLNKEHFNLIWKDYSTDEKEVFLAYLLKSNLVAEVKPFHDVKRNYSYLIPTLFEAKSRDKITWQEKDTYIVIKFRFVFKAIMHQLQVRILSHCHPKDEETFYQDYISFTSKQNQDAYIQLLDHEKELRIYSTNTELIETILNEVNNIYPLDRVETVQRNKQGQEEPYRFKSNDRTLFNNDDMPSKQKKKKVFISYSNADVDDKNELYKDQLLTHLKPLEKFGLIEPYDCSQIRAGKWNEQIQRKLEASDIMIFMVSASFMASDYIIDNEVEKGIALANNDPSKKIMCVLVTECFWQQWPILDKSYNNDGSSDLSQFQFLPYNTHGKRALLPLEEWGKGEIKSINSAYTQIVKKLMDELND